MAFFKFFFICLKGGLYYFKYSTMTQINLVEDILIFSYIHVVPLGGLFFPSDRHVSDDKNNHLVKFWQTEESDTTALNTGKWQSRLNVDPDRNTLRGVGWMKRFRWHSVVHIITLQHQSFIHFISRDIWVHLYCLWVKSWSFFF